MRREAAETDRISKFLDDMMADEEFLQKSSIRQKIYKDEPILRRASQMKNFVPQRIIEMRELARDHLSFGWSNAALFYKQAKYMEDYEDDYDYHGDFVRYYPTYQFMSDDQLRGYFSWRTRVRRGETEAAPLAFVYMYMYELINCIGAPTAQECWTALRDFGEAYSAFDPTIDMYLKTWLFDMAVYYSIDVSIVENEPLVQAYRAYGVLNAPEGRAPEEITGALLRLSSYNLENSAFYKEHPEEVKGVLPRVFDALYLHYAKNCKNTFCEQIFGKSHCIPYEPFSGAVFYRRLTLPDRSVEITPDFRFYFRSGRWYKLCLDASPEKNKKLGALMKNIDAVMRAQYGYPKPLQSKGLTKMLSAIVVRAVEETEKEKQRREAARIDFDLSRLSVIRENADETREKLITQEEKAEEPVRPPERELFPAEENSPGREERAEQAAPEVSGNAGTEKPEDCPLNEDEFFVLCCLLDGTDYTEALRKKALFPSVVIDRINDSLFDIFGDTVIFFDSDEPYIAEDYMSELKELTGRR